MPLRTGTRRKTGCGQAGNQRIQREELFDRINITRSRVGEHRIVSAPSGNMAYEYGTVHMGYDSKRDGHEQLSLFLLEWTGTPFKFSIVWALMSGLGPEH
jgi:hypothetical protein